MIRPSRANAGKNDRSSRRKSSGRRRYLQAFKYRRRLLHRAVKVQSYVRMWPRLRAFLAWRERRRRKRRHHLLGWRAAATSATFFARHCKRRNLRAWREQTENAAQQRAVTWAMFERRLGKEKLTVCAVNLFFDTADMPPPPSNTVKVVTIGIRRKIYKTIFNGWRAFAPPRRKTSMFSASSSSERSRRRRGVPRG